MPGTNNALHARLATRIPVYIHMPICLRAHILYIAISATGVDWVVVAARCEAFFECARARSHARALTRTKHDANRLYAGTTSARARAHALLLMLLPQPRLPPPPTMPMLSAGWHIFTLLSFVRTVKVFGSAPQSHTPAAPLSIQHICKPHTHTHCHRKQKTICAAPTNAVDRERIAERDTLCESRAPCICVCLPLNN